ncbi:ribosome production factor 2 [Enteropsectra breve]|nr:ribosome production factor 2 [Enteropsectra breve]
MALKNATERKQMLCITKKAPRAIKELMQIRGDASFMKETVDCYSDNQQALKHMKKMDSSLLISHTGEEQLVLGRTFNNEFMELIKFKINVIKSSQDFSTLPPEPYVKYFILVQNIKNKFLENLFIDIFAQKSHEIDIGAIRYAWIINQNEKIFTMKYVRVMNDLSIEDIGPYFEMEIEKEFYCGDVIRTEATDLPSVRKIKNVEKNEFKDTIGKIHIDKQDLKDINLRKNRAYKSKASGSAAE